MPQLGPSSFDEAARQLNICNSCRYCAGYCPVWPALERRVDLTPADVTHLANLCHDCRDCYLACMYTPPHEFGVNPPKIFAEERTSTYHRFIWPAARVRDASGTVVAIVATAVVAALLAVLSWLSTNGTAFEATDGSAYAVIRHDLLLVLVSAPAVYALIVLAVAAARYWRFTHGPLGALMHGRSWIRALREALTLRHQTGADEGCTYPGDRPTMSRRVLHQFVMVGFFLTFLSTTAAAFEQYFLALLPPYPYASVPVISGLVGGVAQIVGCIGLLRLKRLSDPDQGTSVMRRADVSFLWSLIVLNGTGLLVLFTRTTPLFGEILVVHLAAVIVAFSVAPYTKFVHFIFRTLAIYKNVLEGQAQQTEPAQRAR
ncbi:tricarballylate utilization 4Fe-4S protein TcuB [Gryllotalpicola protaetiae]|nr:tricarballylate utilization 4Fe-4S protein TcuB [Gryllotalpicola protaetiae]